MLKGLNSFLRGIFIVFGALFLLMEFMPEKRVTQDHKEGFENEEFDDIW